MFKATDSRNKRRKFVIAHAEMDLELGVLLAAVDFEWTCRRCMMLFSNTATQTLKDKFTSSYRAFSGLEIGWKEEVLPHLKHNKYSLCDVFEVWLPGQNILKRPISWSQIVDAMSCRNLLVHGTESSIKRKDGRTSIYTLETACDVLEIFVRAKDAGLSLSKRISRRRKEGDVKETSIQQREKRNLGLAGKFGPNHWINRKFGW